MEMAVDDSEPFVLLFRDILRADFRGISVTSGVELGRLTEDITVLDLKFSRCGLEVCCADFVTECRSKADCVLGGSSGIRWC